MLLKLPLYGIQAMLRGSIEYVYLIYALSRPQGLRHRIPSLYDLFAVSHVPVSVCHYHVIKNGGPF